ncbi:MAG TPA: prepilin-type N-terminal cleavage/methylation domain-containing protein [Chthonomonadaceae bacterium]|nr:prepilin-type N-terminal cleavage/methylation domain-containing protein [Chthonomonadaceae bacterium]
MQYPPFPHVYKRGLTLVELLVVIAIIAVLTAILFPVFGLVRAKTRQADCQSNFKQIALAFSLYCQDYDETLPPCISGKLKLDVSLLSTQQSGSFWPELVMPYAKNWQILACQQDPNANDRDYLQQAKLPANTTGLLLEKARALCTDFGYNYHYLSPSNQAHNVYEGVALSAIRQSAATILGTDSALALNYEDNAGYGNYYVFPPDISGWMLTGPLRSYGFVAPRHFHRANVAFVDGHVKAETIEALLQGFDVETQKIADPVAYLWDLQ